MTGPPLAADDRAAWIQQPLFVLEFRRATTKSDIGLGLEMTERESPADNRYSRLVGERLRGIRKQKRLSLQEVEQQSQTEFRASVLGAYERGERAISV